MSLLDRFGYSTDEIDSYAREVLQSLLDMELPLPLIMLALCRAITVIATDQELDMASSLLDELKEADIDDFRDILGDADDDSDSEGTE